MVTLSRMLLLVFSTLLFSSNSYAGLLITKDSEKTHTREFIEDLVKRGNVALTDLEGQADDIIPFLDTVKDEINNKDTLDEPRKKELIELIDNQLVALNVRNNVAQVAPAVSVTTTTTTMPSPKTTSKRSREEEVVDVEQEKVQKKLPKVISQDRDNELLPRYLTKGYPIHQELCYQNKIKKEDAQFILDNKLMRSGVSVSGGGTRAMAAACALSNALNMATTPQGASLLDAFDYFAGLSGSTWFALQCIGHMKPISEMKEIIQRHFDGRSFFDSLRSRLLSVALGESHVIDHYVGLLHKHFFSSEGMNTDFTQCRNHLDAGSPAALQYPYFLFPAFIQDCEKSDWFEYTAHKVGLPHLNYTIDEKDFMPNHHLMKKSRLAGCAGLFGSAFATNSIDNVQLTKEYLGAQLSEQTRNFLSSGVQGLYNFWNSVTSFNFSSVNKFSSSHKVVTAYRPFAPSIPNFIPEHQRSTFSESLKKDTLKLFDPGIQVNLPLYLLLKRNCNLIFVLDVTDDVCEQRFSGIDGAAKDARERGIKFPAFTHDKLVRQGLTVLYDEADPEVPVIIYMNVWLKDFGRLSLKSEHFTLMNDTVYQIVRENLATIIKAYGIAYRNVIEIGRCCIIES